jgi:hypothetical protein
MRDFFAQKKFVKRITTFPWQLKVATMDDEAPTGFP